MDPISIIIFASLTVVFIGLPTLLVCMAWITRDVSAVAIRPILKDQQPGHAARVRAARRASKAFGLSAAPPGAP